MNILGIGPSYRDDVSDVFIADIPDERIEGIWRQVIDFFRGGILADW